MSGPHLNVLFLMTSVFSIVNDISNKSFSHNVIYALLTKLGTFRFILTTRGVMELRRDELITLGAFEPEVMPIRLLNLCKKEMYAKIACDIQDLRLQQTRC